MVGFLGLVAGLSYLLAILSFIVAIGASDIQFILSALCATCGTVAAAGGALVDRIDQLRKQLELRAAPSSAASRTLSDEERAGM